MDSRTTNPDYNDELTKKAKHIKQVVDGCISSIMKINSMFDFTRQLLKLTKNSHAKLWSIGLLNKGGGYCPKCNAMYNLIAHSRGNGLRWKCTKCKKCQKSTWNKLTFANSTLSLHQFLIIIFRFVSKAKVKITIALLKLDSKTVTDWNLYRSKVCARFFNENLFEIRW